jgi:hypothetical protein
LLVDVGRYGVDAATRPNVGANKSVMVGEPD